MILAPFLYEKHVFSFCCSHISAYRVRENDRWAPHRSRFRPLARDSHSYARDLGFSRARKSALALTSRLFACFLTLRVPLPTLLTLLVAGCWLLTACCWLLTAGCCWDCLRLPATACDCLQLPATACGRLRVHATVCGYLRLPGILGGWPEFAHLESENMVPYWVPELGPKIGTQFQMISFPLEFMLATS
jgi:hypothetical protein